jgi:hypothetical protein
MIVVGDFTEEEELETTLTPGKGGGKGKPSK